MHRATFCTAVVLLAAAVPAAAQEPPVSRLVPELIASAAVIGRGETGDHREHFLPGLSTLGVIHELNRSIALQAAGFPLGPVSPVVSSRGRSGTEQPALFGAGYTQTAFGLGPKRLLFSVSYQTTTFDTFDDLDLRDSPIHLYIPHAPVTGDDSDRDMLHQVVSLRLNRKTVAFALNYGVGPRIDLGVVLPVVQVAAEARVTTHIVRTASAQNPAVHEFDIIDRANRTFPRYCSDQEVPAPSQTSLECAGSSTARGIGDLLFRGKFALVNASATALAFSVDVRLPTGDADELIGLGATQVTPALAWSLDAGRIGARARAEYTWSEGDLSSRLAEGAEGLDLNVPDEIGLGIGIDADIAPRTTLALDVLGRRTTNMRQFSTGTLVFPGRGPGAAPADFIGEDALVQGDTRTLTQVMAALGLRFDVPGGVVAQVSALIPVSGGGLQPQSMAVFSLTKRY